jgi:hypothetical protein
LPIRGFFASRRGVRPYALPELPHPPALFPKKSNFPSHPDAYPGDFAHASHRSSMVSLNCVGAYGCTPPHPRHQWIAVTQVESLHNRHAAHFNDRHSISRCSPILHTCYTGRTAVRPRTHVTNELPPRRSNRRTTGTPHISITGTPPLAIHQSYMHATQGVRPYAPT